MQKKAVETKIDDLPKPIAIEAEPIPEIAPVVAAPVAPIVAEQQVESAVMIFGEPPEVEYDGQMEACVA